MKVLVPQLRVCLVELPRAFLNAIVGMTVREDVASIESIRDFAGELEPYWYRWICSIACSKRAGVLRQI
jgi:hypothetical protein